MSGYISRSKLIKAVEDLQDCYNGFSDTYDKSCIIGLIDGQPSVERKRGKWKAASEDLIICTSCKCGFLLPYPNRIEEAKTVYGWNFCPNCGADMRGDSDV